jgi:hypothetical protein
MMSRIGAACLAAGLSSLFATAAFACGTGGPCTYTPASPGYAVATQPPGYAPRGALPPAPYAQPYGGQPMPPYPPANAPSRYGAAPDSFDEGSFGWGPPLPPPPRAPNPGDDFHSYHFNDGGVRGYGYSYRYTYPAQCQPCEAGPPAYSEGEQAWQGGGEAPPLPEDFASGGVGGGVMDYGGGGGGSGYGGGFAGAEGFAGAHAFSYAYASASASASAHAGGKGHGCGCMHKPPPPPPPHHGCGCGGHHGK